MKVDELIEVLQEQDPDREVYIVADSSDHWHTLLAREVRAIENDSVYWSACSKSYILRAEDAVGPRGESTTHPPRAAVLLLARPR